ncbi:protein Wnt-10a [Zootermopsis nevadensis]|nr:protein Wnt-10a [Zootermopsis nevadensis]
MLWVILLMTSSSLLSVVRTGVSSADLEQGLLVATGTVCKTFPGLSKEQLDLCRRYPDVTASAIQGLQLAVDECQYQFQWHRWNCSSLSTKNRNPHSSVLLQRGFRESAFAYAISSAGVAHSVARACSMGKLMACGCDPGRYRAAGRLGSNKNSKARNSRPQQRTRSASRWKWGGCSHNLDYGVDFSKSFLDSREKAGDIQSQINLHNNQAGRLAVATNMQVRCKCHGMSGSCELKTCWKAAPDFRVVGEALKERFRSAVLVDQSNLGNGSPFLLEGVRRRRPRPRPRTRPRRRTRLRRPRDLALDLLYYQRSPNFCEQDPSVDFPGTSGRRCNRTSTAVDGCGSLCCGRGYNLIKQKTTDRCHCRFHWCCYVVCQNCTTEEWITVCK